MLKVCFDVVLFFFRPCISMSTLFLNSVTFFLPLIVNFIKTEIKRYFVNRNFTAIALFILVCVEHLDISIKVKLSEKFYESVVLKTST